MPPPIGEGTARQRAVLRNLWTAHSDHTRHFFGLLPPSAGRAAQVKLDQLIAVDTRGKLFRGTWKGAQVAIKVTP